MKYVLTLVGNRRDPALIRNAADLARTALRDADADAALPDWLAPDTAVDLGFDGIAVDRARAAATAALGALPVDCAVQPLEQRRKRLLVADMDSTIVTCETIDELAAAAGKRDEVARLTELAMQGLIADYADSLRRRVAMLAGLPVTTLERVYRERVAVSPGARELLATMRRGGAVTALVSGGFTYFVGRVAADLGFDRFHANALEIADERLTGRVGEPILDGAAKRRILETTCMELAIAPAESLGVGDGANDRGLIEAAGLGVAYRAKPTLAAVADAQVRYGDLTALLYFQGYREAEIGP